MKSEPNTYDAAFAAAMLGHRMENATLNTMTRVALAALAIAELDAEEAIPEGCYEELLDRVAERLRDQRWPSRGVLVSAAVRDVLAVMEVHHA